MVNAIPDIYQKIIGRFPGLLFFTPSHEIFHSDFENVKKY